MSIRKNFSHTIYACYLGYITQAIVNNFAPLLFLTFQSSYAIPLEQITLLVTVNFATQLIVDALSAKFVDRLGYRVCIVTAHLLSAVGLIGLAVLPRAFGAPFVGLVISVILYAIGGGLIEVLVSPIVEACPSERKEAAMSLLHSFYCWGQMSVVLLTTLFFTAFGISEWPLLAVLWALLPLGNAVFFCVVPIQTLTADGKSMRIIDLLKSKVFWIFALLMMCAGSSELSMSQWASAFAESGLHVSKAVGDLAGPCLFALFMGSFRALYAKHSAKLPLQNAMIGGGCLCIVGYLLASLAHSPIVSLIGCTLVGLSVGLFWPGTFSLASKRCPSGGTAMFALLALAGDLGCSLGPSVVGFVANSFHGELRFGLLAAVIFPLLLLFGMWLCKRSDA